MMEEEKFKSNGGPIFAEIESGHAQPGSYSLFIWKADENKIVRREEGNFINTADDKYELPLPLEQYDGQILDVGITLIITPPIKDYHTELIVTQGNKKIGGDMEEGQSEDRTKSLKLMVKLVKEN